MRNRIPVVALRLIGGMIVAAIGRDSGAAVAAATIVGHNRPVGVAAPASSERLQPNVPHGHLDLNGTWHFRTDPENKGVEEKWFENPQLNEWGVIHVPNTWQKQGWRSDGSPGSPSERLQRPFVLKTYHGVGWYGREIKLPCRRGIFLK